MAKEPKQNLIRWAESTLRLRLSDDEQMLYSDENVIVIGQNGHPSKLIGTYGFIPTVLSDGLQLELIQLKAAIIGAFGLSVNQKEFQPIPEWLSSLTQLETLVLTNVDLNNIGVCRNLPLKYLDLRKVRYDDRAALLNTIGNLNSLKIFVHDESLSKEDVSAIKSMLPNAKFASKGSEKTGK